MMRSGSPLRLRPAGMLVRILLLTAMSWSVAGPAAAQEAPASPVVVWESGGLSQTTIEAARVAASTQSADVFLRRSGTLRLMGVTRAGSDVQRPEQGYGYPMSVLSVDPGDPLMAPDEIARIPDGAVVMSQRSADLRGAQIGDVLELEGWNGEVIGLRLADVLPDGALDWYEIVMTTATADRLDLDRQAAMVLEAPNGTALVSALRWFIRAPTVRIGTPANPIEFTDRTLPTIILKERFGEFAFRPTGRGDGIAIQQEWLDANIVTIDLDGLGPFRCNRGVIPYLRAAVDELHRRDLMGVIDYTDFQLAGGCFNPRLMRGGDKGFALSRHAWGVAIDFNPSTNRYGGETTLPEEVGAVMRRWGFSWGATWTVPDGMHFEWARTPETLDVCTVRLVDSPSSATTWEIDSIGCP